jgi:predicted amidohydrolase
LRIAGIILKWVTADKEENYRRVEPLIREAAAKGAQIVMTTECFLDGYAIRDKSIPLEKWRTLCEPIPDGPYVTRLRHLAAELKIHLIAGMTECENGHTYNTAVLIGPDGGLIGKYHKHLLEHELVRNTPGSTCPVFETPLGKIGLMICADRREPDLVKQLKANGAQLLLCPSGGMWGAKENDYILQARSRENHLSIVFVHPIEFLVTSPNGTILDQKLIGDQMFLDTPDLNSPKDQHLVAIYDLPVAP